MKVPNFSCSPLREADQSTLTRRRTSTAISVLYRRRAEVR
ncbi:hypothetical protein I552_8227 [Mycobacterium xenopi 3993]|nr:hypothetical protein I552_8227 [Mycobacterium xenopi 3993]